MIDSIMQDLYISGEDTSNDVCRPIVHMLNSVLSTIYLS